MTDKEVIKALECCIKNGCDNCPFNRLTHLSDCLNMFLNLINRQKAEIERLEKEVDRLSQVVMYNDSVADLKASDAIKEFANKLKNEIIDDTAYAEDCTQHTGYYDYTIKFGDIPEYIDNLVKEMVGDEE